MKRIQIERHRIRREREYAPAPVDPRDPDILWAKRLIDARPHPAHRERWAA